MTEVVTSLPFERPPHRVVMDVTPHGPLELPPVVGGDYGPRYKDDNVLLAQVLPGMYHHSINTTLTFKADIIPGVVAPSISQVIFDFGDGVTAFATLTSPLHYEVTHTYQAPNPGVIAHCKAIDANGDIAYASMNMLLAYGNSLTNSSFEDITGFSGTNGPNFTFMPGWKSYTGLNPSFTMQTTGPINGTYYLRMTQTGAGDPIGILIDSYYVQATATATYTFSTYAKVAVGTPHTLQLYVEFFNASSVFLTSGVTAVTPTTSWARYSGTFTAPAGTVKAIPYLLYAGTTIGDAIDFDAVQWESGSVATAYKPG